MLMDKRFILCELNAERLVACGIGVVPLDVGTKFFKCRVRFRGRLAELLSFERADRRNLSFDYKHSHVVSSSPRPFDEDEPPVRIFAGLPDAAESFTRLGTWRNRAVGSITTAEVACGPLGLLLAL